MEGFAEPTRKSFKRPAFLSEFEQKYSIDVKPPFNDIATHTKKEPEILNKPLSWEMVKWLKHSTFEIFLEN